MLILKVIWRLFIPGYAVSVAVLQKNVGFTYIKEVMFCLRKFKKYLSIVSFNYLLNFYMGAQCKCSFNFAKVAAKY